MAKQNITQPAFNAGVVSGELTSRIDFDKIRNALKGAWNWRIRPAGGMSFRPGTKMVHAVKYPEKSEILHPFIYSRMDSLALEFGEGYIRFHKDQNTMLNPDGTVAELETPYMEADLRYMKFAQEVNQLYISCRGHIPRVLTRTINNDGTYTWTLEDFRFEPEVKAPLTIACTPGPPPSTTVQSSEWKYAVSAVNKDGQESMPCISPNFSSDIEVNEQNITVDWTVNDDDTVAKYFLYRVKGGTLYFFQAIDRVAGQTAYSFKDVGYALDQTHSVKQFLVEFDPDDYPQVIGISKQRLALGRTKKDPNKFWLSRIKEYQDFSKSAVSTADQAIELKLSVGEADPISHFVSLDDMMIMTESKVWRQTGNAASTMQAFIESNDGVSNSVRPFVSRKTAVYVNSSENTPSSFIYSYELNGYTGDELDILAKELFDGYTITDLTLQQYPYSIFYCIRSDGMLMGLTYLREQSIYAWHPHRTAGKFTAICNVSRPQNDDVYVIVQRDGGRFVEVMMQDISAVQDARDAWHLDCATQFKPTVDGTELTGLDHLEGQKVNYLHNGNVAPELQTVAGGKISVDYKAGDVILVGLPFDGEFEMIPKDFVDGSGSSTVGINRRITEVTMKYYRTRGLSYVSSTGGTETDIKPYTDATFGEPIPLLSEVETLQIEGAHDPEATIKVFQRYPLPAIIQSITLGIEYGSKN